MTTPARRTVELLDPRTADQIAAGEVIERPASVAKELVENSLDAEAREVHVELSSGGRERILVRDDGFGMSPRCAERACLRHATSKLRRIEELAGITSLGFRGEALASIAAVAELTITTRARGAEEGCRVEVVQGRVVEVRPVGAPVGTTLEVRELFAAVPARRKFLRSAQTEVGHTSEMLTRLALARPEVGFRCVHERRELLHYPAVQRPEERLRQVLGAERARAMLAVEHRENGVVVRGWISRAGSSSFPQARSVQTFVGGRFVRDRVLLRAILDGYRGLLPQGRYPCVVLHLEVLPGAVDVNVHPAKTEVRFAAADDVYAAVLHAVRHALATAVAAPAAPLPQRSGVAAAAAAGAPVHARTGGLSETSANEEGRTRSLESGVREAFAEYSRRSVVAPAPPRLHPRPAPASLSILDEDQAAGTACFSDLRILGQALTGYIVCEGRDGLVLIDQHAAHERVRFERLRAHSRALARFPSQRLLVPRIIEVGALVRAQLEAIGEELERSGFELEAFGPDSVVVRALPAALDVSTDVEALLADLARDLERIGAREQLGAARDTLLARIACHGAVRAGEALADEEMRAVVAALDEIPFAATCPHGRPLLFEISRAEIARRVGRT